MTVVQKGGKAMKVLTLQQPYASLIALGVKTIETRPNKTNIRGRIAIHAAKKRPKGGWYDVDGMPPLFADLPDRLTERLWDSAEDVNGSYSYHWCWRGPLGAIVATADLVDCVPMVSMLPCQDEWIAPWKLLTLAPWPILNYWPGYGSAQTVKVYADQLPYGDFRPGRWAWLLRDIEPLDVPVPFKGGQGWSKTWIPDTQMECG